MRSILLIVSLFVIMLIVSSCSLRFTTGEQNTEHKTKPSLLLQDEDSASEDQRYEAVESGIWSSVSKQVNLTQHGGPAPQYVLFEIEPEYQEYKTGETILFRIKLTNEWDTELHIVNEPKLRVGPAASDTEEMEEIPVPALVDLTLEPGKSLNTTAEWKQTGRAGRYRVEMGEIDLGVVRTSGGGQTFVVEDSNEKMLVRTIDGSGKITIPSDQLAEKSTIYVKQIELTEHETVVKLEIHTKQAAPLGFHVSLVRNDDMSEAETALSLEQSENIDGVITGTLTFNPSTVDTKQMRLVFTSWDVVHYGDHVETFEGPWSIELPME
ncbi:hypothetical protein [Paenibacillus xylaniclasticus]|uniref:hypothetical protein n=1 Tax=Paenibacillus xylaniclasticus TaxID=588083 RepID=UPI000FDA7796|nr:MULTISPECIES: hypothetical protein [Paenibacillus]GFN30487.1 hypothetical protein PCURB6_07470 [Paenibacillus curdlanolyticus]